MELQKEAHDNHVPIIREEMRELLRLLVTMEQPMNILEIGTAIGYSAIVMNEKQPEGGRITTIERNDKRYERAIDNIAKAGRQDRITVHFGDAVEVLERIDDTFDFIFTDAAKGQYSSFFDLTLHKLKPGGLLVCDNVLQDGSIAQSRYAVTRRDHTIHSRMREFLYMIKHHEQLETVILPVGDGVTISKKVKE